ncbi:hypothetical protein ACFWJ4_34995 [Kitasatospora sp. NPDC127067]|uniref:hypothetical protein n=1 Tax=Kitasatospora sp. NPDC127067 TaxID=3347126 RepID=UPI00364A2E6B
MRVSAALAWLSHVDDPIPADLDSLLAPIPWLRDAEDGGEDNGLLVCLTQMGPVQAGQDRTDPPLGVRCWHGVDLVTEVFRAGRWSERQAGARQAAVDERGPELYVQLPSSCRWLALAIGQADRELPFELLAAIGEASSLPG